MSSSKTQTPPAEDNTIKPAQASDFKIDPPAQESTSKTTTSPDLKTQLTDLKTKVSTYQTKIEEMTAEAKDLKLRHAAEMRNNFDREQKKLADTHDFSISKFAEEVLLIADALHQGIENSQAQEQDGLKLILKLLQQKFNKFNITEINPLNQPYDYHEHEAISMVPTDEHPENQIIQVVQIGYKIKQRLLRPARVIVAKTP